MTDLITWLRAQLDTDALDAPDTHSIDCAVRYGVAGSPGDCDCGAPTRVLRQVQAHRAILDDYARAVERRKQHPDDLASAGALLALHGVVKRLLPIYSDRDGYDPDWSA